MLPLIGNAKTRKPIVQVKDTVPLFRSVAVSGDLFGAIQKAVSSYGQYEGAVRVNLKDRYFPIIEIGLGQANTNDATTNITYKTTAPYARIGIDYNLLRNKHDDYRLYGGVRYAFSSFKYDISSPGINDPVWGDKVPFGATGLKGTYHWAELVLGVDAKIWRFFRLDWSVRYRQRIAHSDDAIGNAWYIPGYGKNSSSRLGGTFNIIFEL